ncbi:hypothetical protein U8527_20400 [Kordia algicida OT-1]|uniref:Uncharacterized protein n=1 Tax=Kordia algicida OT-1 TaxID=391587 RepID=A9DKM8_9FLAO|nr:hypothetical protein [Kordia algicida]EDP98359.1 hypothetical protein KAOT1_14117 [Kordia algicida OT-1]
MLSSTFQKLSKSSEKKLLFLAITTFMLAGSCMLYFDRFLKTDFAPNKIISFELSSTLKCSQDILMSWQKKEGALQAAEWSLWFDYIFIITYVMFLSLLIHLVRKHVADNSTALAYRLGTVLIGMTMFAGFLDMVENFALLQLFYGDLQKHWTLLAFATASIKFMHIGLGLLYVVIGFGVILLKKIK